MLDLDLGFSMSPVFIKKMVIKFDEHQIKAENKKAKIKNTVITVRAIVSSGLNSDNTEWIDLQMDLWDAILNLCDMTNSPGIKNFLLKFQ